MFRNEDLIEKFLWKYRGWFAKPETKKAIEVLMFCIEQLREHKKEQNEFTKIKMKEIEEKSTPSPKSSDYLLRTT